MSRWAELLGPDVGRAGTARAGFDVVADLLAADESIEIDGLGQTVAMEEVILAILAGDKAEAAIGNDLLDGACGHERPPNGRRTGYMAAACSIGPMRVLPERPPFALRARLLSPLADGGTLDVLDGCIEVDARGRISRIGQWDGSVEDVVDLRPMIVLPGMIDLHVHLPQIPNAGLGSGLDLLPWLDRYIFPLERAYDRDVASREMPHALRAFASAGTTTIVAYAALWEDSTDAAFAAAERHGIRAVIGKVMMDRFSYDTEIAPHQILETSLRQSDALAGRWHGRDAGRLQYAFTPRFAVSCSADMLRESAALAAHHGAYWQTHLSEDDGEVAEVRRLFPEAQDYLDVYDRAGALRPRTILAHAIHLSDREVARLAESGAGVAHCPASNLFLSSGLMPLSAYRAGGNGGRAGQ